MMRRALVKKWFYPRSKQNMGAEHYSYLREHSVSNFTTRENARARSISQTSRHSFRSNIYEKVEKIINLKKGKVHPKKMSFDCEYLMKECRKQNTAKGGESAIKLLKRLIEEKKYANKLFLNQRKKKAESSIDQFIVKDTFFHAAMLACSRRHNNSDKIDDLLRLMADEHNYDLKIKEEFADGSSSNGWIDMREKRVSCRPTTSSYNIFLNALSMKSSDPAKAANSAEKALDEMVSLHGEKNWHTKPNTRSYELVIRAHENSNTLDAGDKARDVFDRMKTAHKTDLQHYRRHSFSGDYDFNDASKNYKQIVVVTTKAARSVISAYLKKNTRRSAQLAEKFLLSCIPKDRNSDDAVHIFLDETLFNTVIQGWKKSMRRLSNSKARTKAANRAEKLLMLMKSISENSNLPFNSNIYPSTTTYNLCLHAWAKSDDEEAAARSLSLFNDLVASQNANPDISSYHSLMTAFSRSFLHNSKSAHQVEEILNKLINAQLTQNLKNSLKPTALTYSISIDAWAKAKETYDENGIHKAIHARRLLDALLEQHAMGEIEEEPLIHAFTSVCRACTFKGNDDEEEILNIAIKTYNEKSQSVLVDDEYFATMLKAIQIQTLRDASQRKSMVERIHADAKEAGCVSQKVTQELRRFD